jgi:hypothetical protein
MSEARAQDATERRELHARARAFIAACADGVSPPETFDALGLAIARYQAANIAPYRRLISSTVRDLAGVAKVRELPAVPTDVFRLTRVAAHPPSDDVAIFRTSGTTSGARGEHALSTTATYEAAALAWGRWAMFFDAPVAMSAIALCPPPVAGPSGTESSLHFMMQLFGERFATHASYLQRSRDALSEPRDVIEACARAAYRGAPAIVMGASFAFVHLFDALGGERLPLPTGSRIMHTGGFKGRSREVEADELVETMATTFCVPEGAIVGEYGMTELSSQLYETTLRAPHGFDDARDIAQVARDAARGAHGMPGHVREPDDGVLLGLASTGRAAVAPGGSRKRGIFIAPGWMRVAAVDSDTLRPLPDGEIGILRFEDLANVDSALVVQTADRGRCHGATVELLGRLPGATPRGCSLAVEELMAGP